MGEIFKASPLLRPRPGPGPATSSLATIAEIEQPIVIEDDDDTKMTGDSAGPPVERYVVPKEPAAVPVFDISDFPMTLPGLPSSIALSPATTLPPETPRAPIGRLPSTAYSPKPMGPPPVQNSSPKPKAPT